MKTEFKPLSWKVKAFDVNNQVIEDYDILKYREDFIKKLKKKCATKEEFSERLRREMLCCYWSKCEWELIIEVDDNNHVWLSPWAGCRNPENVRVDVTDRTDFDWKGFATYHIDRQTSKNKAKIDVYDQITYVNQLEELVDYCWYTRLKWERRNSKFDK